MKEMRKDSQWRRDALYVLQVCQRLSSKREVPEIVAWLEAMGTELLTVRLRSAGLAVNLKRALAGGCLGEEV